MSIFILGRVMINCLQIFRIRICKYAFLFGNLCYNMTPREGVKVQPVDSEIAKIIKKQLIERCTFTKTGMSEVDDFLEFVRKDISFIRKNLGVRHQGYVDDAAELAYRFVLSTIPQTKGMFKTYRYVELRELALLEREIYGASSRMNMECSFIPTITPDDFVKRLELLGMKKGTVLMNPSLRRAHELLSRIYFEAYPASKSQIANIIYCSQEYALIVFQNIDLVGGMEYIFEVEKRFDKELERIQSIANSHVARRESMTKVR